MYNFNLNIINPAYVSLKESPEANFSFRSQWTGVPDAPKTSLLSFVSPINDELGIGLSIMNDQIFILNKTDASLDIAYELQISDDYYVHFGLKTGVSFVNLNLSNAGAPEEDYKFSENENYIVPTLGAGIYFKHPKYYLSLSTPNASKVDRYSLEEDSPAIVANQLHVYFGGGYYFNVNREVSVIPAIMTRFIAGASTTYDLSTTIDVKDVVKGGVNYRWDETVSVYSLFSTKGNYDFGFSYDMNVSNIAKVNTNGSLELLIRYNWE